MTRAARFVIRLLRRLMPWCAATALAVVLASWLVSRWRPHGVTVTGFNQHVLLCHDGVVQWRTKSATDVVLRGDIYLVEPVSVRATSRVPPPWIQGTPQGPTVVLAAWPPVSHAQMVISKTVFAHNVGWQKVGVRTEVLGVAHWLPALVLAVPVGWWVAHAPRRGRAARRLAQGLCPACGYDLRATPQRCPECGWAAAAPRETAGAVDAV